MTGGTWALLPARQGVDLGPRHAYPGACSAGSFLVALGSGWNGCQAPLLNLRREAP